jgi:hypothetical protein
MPGPVRAGVPAMALYGIDWRGAWRPYGRPGLAMSGAGRGGRGSQASTQAWS